MTVKVRHGGDLKRVLNDVGIHPNTTQRRNKTGHYHLTFREKQDFAGVPDVQEIVNGITSKLDGIEIIEAENWIAKHRLEIKGANPRHSAYITAEITGQVEIIEPPPLQEGPEAAHWIGPPDAAPTIPQEKDSKALGHPVPVALMVRPVLHPVLAKIKNDRLTTATEEGAAIKLTPDSMIKDTTNVA